jgi:predicted HTH transcriptional regulator
VVMKTFHINISHEEYAAILAALSSIKEPVSVQWLARVLDLNVNHLRYAIDQLVENSTLQKICVDDRPSHKRYRYEVKEDNND